MRGGRAWAAIIVVGALGAAGVSCGIEPQDKPSLAKAKDVPFDLLNPPPEATTTSAPGVPTEKATIFFVQGERLAAAERQVGKPKTAEAVLEALVNGPTDNEVALGLRTTLLGLDLVFVRSVGVTGGIATVDLGPTFTDLTGNDQRLALAQIVATLTDLPGIGRVAFTLNGEPRGVPRGDGAITTDSVSRDDYSIFAPVPVG